tara:strand:+ start:212 stop:415 length:204 start_codon:yes stop_codon:yes gene_type:complete
VFRQVAARLRFRGGLAMAFILARRRATPRKPSLRFQEGGPAETQAATGRKAPIGSSHRGFFDSGRLE